MLRRNLLGLVVLPLLLSIGCTSPGTAKTCLPGSTDCGDGCVNLQDDQANCGTCGNSCAAAGSVCVAGTCALAKVLVGSYAVDSGPNWGTNPVTFTCKEACALKFGAPASAYVCSTVGTTINAQSFASTWGVAGCQTVADSFKLNVNYNCGTLGCATSSYVQDNCTLAPKTNFCWR
jgi:hypothetical protein